MSRSYYVIELSAKWLTALLGALAVVVVAAFALGSASLPDLEMRSVPWVTHLGATLADVPSPRINTCSAAAMASTACFISSMSRVSSV